MSDVLCTEGVGIRNGGNNIHCCLHAEKRTTIMESIVYYMRWKMKGKETNSKQKQCLLNARRTQIGQQICGVLVNALFHAT